jgi:anaerobic magnesium-protoporphyrin IX monomethyl ester cyclase
MRVLMVQSLSVAGPSDEKVYPIGIVSLSSRLREAGHEVDILDMNIEAEAFAALKDRLVGFRPEVVAVSLRNVDPLGNKTVSLVPQFVAVIKMISGLLPEAWIIVGGTGFSLFPGRLMQELPEIHYGIVGEAEHSLPSLLSSLGNPGPLKGLCVRNGRKIKITPPSTDFDMKRYAVVDRELLNPSLYLSLNSYVPVIGIETKRGCPFRCSYCVYPKLQGRRLRCRPPASVVDEIEFLHKQYGIRSFHFTDPVVNIPRGHLEDICREILRRKLEVRWDGFLREDYLDDHNIALFEKSGCECFSFSPDGLCQESLDALGKGLDESDILKAASLASRTDVISVYHFMVNVPGETKETSEKGMRMIDRIYDLHSARKNLGTVVLNNARILPGTAIEAAARDQSVISADTDLLYPVYYNPVPFEALRHKLETLHLCRNIFMRQGEI